MFPIRQVILAAALVLAPPLVSTSFAQNTSGTTVAAPVSGYSTNVYKTKHHKKPIHGTKTGPGAKAGSGSGLGESSGTSSGN